MYIKGKYVSPDEAQKMISEEYMRIADDENAPYDIIDGAFGGASNALHNILHVMDTICQYSAGHSFMSCIKITNIGEEPSRLGDDCSYLKHAVISIGWGDLSITDKEYYAEYDIGKDTLHIHETDMQEKDPSWEKTFQHPFKKYEEIMEGRWNDFRKYVADPAMGPAGTSSLWY